MTLPPHPPAQPSSLHLLDESVQRYLARPGRHAIVVGSVCEPAEWLTYNADAVMPAASLLKLPLVVAAIEREGLDALRTRIVPPSQLPDTAYPSPSRAWPSPLSFAELCALVVTTSDNPAANALLDLVGFETVASWLSGHGLDSTSLEVGFQDHEFGSVGRSNTTTARDMAHLFEWAWQERTDHPGGQIWAWLTNGVRNARLPGLLDGRLFFPVGHKTGTLTDVANDTGVILTDPPLLMVVLSCDADPDDLGPAQAELARDCVTAWLSTHSNERP